MLEYTIFAKKEASMKTYRLTHVFKYAQLLNFFFLVEQVHEMDNTSEQFSIQVNNLLNQELEFFCTSMALF